jgi:ferrous iron transport protein A
MSLRGDLGANRAAHRAIHRATHTGAPRAIATQDPVKGCRISIENDSHFEYTDLQPDLNMHAAPEIAAVLSRPTALADMPNGSHAVVTGLRTDVPGADAALLQRLAEIGFVAGEPVHLLRRGPGGREPLAVQVGDTLFGLRLIEARCVEVNHVESQAQTQARHV